MEVECILVGLIGIKEVEMPIKLCFHALSTFWVGCKLIGHLNYVPFQTNLGNIGYCIAEIKILLPNIISFIGSV